MASNLQQAKTNNSTQNADKLGKDAKYEINQQDFLSGSRTYHPDLGSPNDRI